MTFLFLVIGCGGEEDNNDDGSGAEDADAFFADLEYPEYKYQAKAQVQKDGDGNVSTRFDYEYTDAGRIQTLVQQTEDNSTQLVELQHTTTQTFEYNDQGWLVKMESFSDAGKETKTSDIETTYENDVIKNSVRTVYDTNTGDASSTSTETYDALGRLDTNTTVSGSGDSEFKRVETCTYSDDTANATETCTTNQNDVKVAEEVLNYEENTQTETTFADEDDSEGTKVWDATLIDGYRFFGGEIVKTGTRENSSGRTTVSCEVSTENTNPEVTCTSETVDNSDDKTGETVTRYTLLAKTFRSWGLTVSGYYPVLTSVKSTGYLSDKVANEVDTVYEYNDKYNRTKTTTTRKTANSDDELELDYVETQSYSYDNEGDRILSIKTERTIDDETSTISEITYEYAN